MSADSDGGVQRPGLIEEAYRSFVIGLAECPSDCVGQLDDEETRSHDHRRSVGSSGGGHDGFALLGEGAHQPGSEERENSTEMMEFKRLGAACRYQVVRRRWDAPPAANSPG